MAEKIDISTPQASQAEKDSDRWRRSEERRICFKADLAKAMLSADCQTLHPRPWTCKMVIHDGPGAQFFDANDAPVLGPELLRDPEDAAQLLFNVNSGT